MFGSPHSFQAPPVMSGGAHSGFGVADAGAAAAAAATAAVDGDGESEVDRLVREGLGTVDLNSLARLVVFCPFLTQPLFDSELFAAQGCDRRQEGQDRRPPRKWSRGRESGCRLAGEEQERWRRKGCSSTPTCSRS